MIEVRSEDLRRCLGHVNVTMSSLAHGLGHLELLAVPHQPAHISTESPSFEKVMFRHVDFRNGRGEDLDIWTVREDQEQALSRVRRFRPSAIYSGGEP